MHTHNKKCHVSFEKEKYCKMLKTTNKMLCIESQMVCVLEAM